ncbi:MAG TPA: delta-60 repeat domain-containing protein [Tepidisphaeraceae bacterium]|nr:delta-60 repeat domain-containing protein [Tepidisphaeraceae bacterium]
MVESVAGLAAARYDTNGKLDPSFGTGGTEVLTSLRLPNISGYGLAQEADGKLLVPLFGGIARLATSGALDTSFGTAGTAGFPASVSISEIASILLTRKGQIVGIGSSGSLLVGRWNADGTPDATFGGSGFVQANSPFSPSGAFGNNTGYILRDGDIVALSGSGPMEFTPAGQLNPKFGHRGVEWNPDGLTGTINATALQKNGKIIVAGSELSVSPGAPTEAALARYNRDGSLDASFGQDGRVYMTIGNNAQFNSLVIESDGKIIVGGYGDIGGTQEFLVARLTPGGRLDRSFHRNGVLTSAFAGAASQAVAALAVGPDKTIVAAGSADQQIAAERILKNGDLDPSFATAGQFASQPMGQPSSGAGVVVQGDGKIAIGGTIGNSMGIIRLLPNGQYDGGFGTDGVATASFADGGGNPLISQGNALVEDSKGNLIIGGGVSYLSNVPPGPFSAALARYQPNGQLDPSFGTGGTLMPGAEAASVYSLALDGQGRIIAGANYASVARLTDSGFDTSFGNNVIGNPPTPIDGVATFEASNPNFTAPSVSSVIVQPDGKILATYGTDVVRLLGT